MASQLYEFTLEVAPGKDSDMPHNMDRALVIAYAAADDYQTALKKGVAALAEKQLLFRDLKGSVREIPISSWEAYLTATWPDCRHAFPPQSEIAALVKAGAVFFSPFAGFKSD